MATAAAVTVLGVKKVVALWGWMMKSRASLSHGTQRNLQSILSEWLTAKSSLEFLFCFTASLL
jgi:hypothetical protein